MPGDTREEVSASLHETILVLKHWESQMPYEKIALSYALKKARTADDVGSVSGEEIRFGQNTPTAGIILTAMRFDPTIRSAATLPYSEEIIAVCTDLLFEICPYDGKEGGIAGFDWGMVFCCERSDGVPDIIYNRAIPPGERMMTFLAEDPQTLGRNIIKILSRIIDTTLSEM